MEQRLGRVGVGTPYREGAAGRLAKLATGLTAVGAAVLAARGRRSRAAAISGAALVAGGAIAERWAVFKAGSQSAARPQETVEPQRRRVAAGARGAAQQDPRGEADAMPTEGHRPGERPVPFGRRPSTPGGPTRERDATPHRRRGVALAQRARRDPRRPDGRSSRSRRLQQIVTGALGGEERILVGSGVGRRRS